MEVRPALLFCNNVDGRNNIDSRTIPFLQKHGPFDVMMFQEMFEPDFERLKELFGMDGVFGASCWRAFDIRGEERGEQLYRWGVAILSKDPIIFSQELPYSDEGRNSLPVFREWREGDGDLIENEKRLLLHATTQRGDEQWDWVTTKFTWPPYVVMSHTQLKDLDSMRVHLNRLTSGFVLGLDINSRRGWPIHSTLKRIGKPNVSTTVRSTLDPQLHRASARGIEVVVDEIYTTDNYEADVEVVDGLSDHKGLVAQVRKTLHLPRWVYPNTDSSRTLSQ